VTQAAINYEFDTRPETGFTMPVADGILWLRMPLPFAMGHINLWLLRDDDGWAIVDTGVFTEDARKVWTQTFADALNKERISRVIVTHLHPDHVGCAGWLADEQAVDLWMSRTEYLLCRILVADTGRTAPDEGTRFYHAAGFPADAMVRYRDMFGLFGKYVAPLPEAYKRLADGDLLSIGNDRWEIVIGRGHSMEHACLYNKERNMLISGDQILPTISSNVSVYPTEPAANPLHDWIESLTMMKQRVPDDVLVLPAHGKPFRGAHGRVDALIDEHLDGLKALLDLCKKPIRAVDAFPALFKSEITGKNLMLATGESIAHLNYLLNDGSIVAEPDDDDVIWYRQARLNKSRLQRRCGSREPERSSPPPVTSLATVQ